MEKHDSNLENKTNSKTRYLLPNRSQNIWSALPSFGQQDFHWRCTITLPNPPSALDRTLSPLQYSSLIHVKIRCQHMHPNFGVKCPFYFEINPCHDYAVERSSHYFLLASRAGGGQKSLLCPSPFTFPSTQPESADSPSVFLPTRSQHHGRFIFLTLGYK